MEGGNSVADVLTGRAYPSGKLPVTFPYSLEDVPSTKNFPKDYTFWDDFKLTKEEKAKVPFINETPYEEGLDVGYRYFQTKNVPVSYPFGYGLSYTDFEYSQPKVVKKGKNYVATVCVKNVGQHEGKETVQLYIAAPEGKLQKPAFELRAFAKTGELKPGQSQVLTMTFTDYDLASFDEQTSSWITDAGTYQALFSASAVDCKAKTTFKAKASAVQCHDVMRP